MKPQDALCVCGSGLRSCRCCELSAAYTAPSGTTDTIMPLVKRAQQAFAASNAAAAETLCINVLDVAPRLPAALWMLHQICRRGGRERAAMVLLQRLVGVEPNNVEATQELATALFQQGELPLAEVHARNAVRLAPADPRSHNLMGMILTEAQRADTGEYHYRRAIELTRTRDPILLANLAWNLKSQGNIAEARRLYAESVEAAPGVFQTYFGRAQLEEAARDFSAARLDLNRAEELRPGDVGVRIARATVLMREGNHAAALAELEHPESRADVPADVDSDPNALLLKGRILDRLGRYDEAFASFEHAKVRARERTGKGYFDQQAGEMVQRLRNFFVAGRLRLMPTAPRQDGVAQPIFILGFPRSGTTLIEQALSRHPKISAGDELPFINELSDTMPRLLGSPLAYPEALSELWMADGRRGLELMRDVYLRKSDMKGVMEPGKSWFTDKMPLNEMHLGLIALLFPCSPLIHVLRHPLDVVLSTFSHHLTHGYHCAFALETIARHYVRVMDLVSHYRAEMTLKYLPVRYEDMVADMPATMRRILQFIGEPFDPRCVDFQHNPRLPHTPSYAQVSERLYDRARFRYRHYIKHLQPVVPILQPAMKHLGYELE